jgi:hypothetical protein
MAWTLSALDFPAYPVEVYGYWTVIGTGNAVVGWDLWHRHSCLCRCALRFPGKGNRGVTAVINVGGASSI